jgi:hypothetical protein
MAFGYGSTLLAEVDKLRAEPAALLLVGQRPQRVIFPPHVVRLKGSSSLRERGNWSACRAFL